jgi:hypothetical protein
MAQAPDPSFPYDPNDPELVAHERTYHAVNVLIRWTMTGVAATIALLTVWMATPGGFLGGLVFAAVIMVVGFYLLVRPHHRKPLDPFVPH